MTFMIDEAFLPATLTSPPMSDVQFAEFCSEHPELHFEMTATGEIIIMPPTFFLTGARNSEISSQLRNWARVDGRGIATDSSTGFALPNGARRSPDAAWTPKDKIPAAATGYLHTCPAFVIELRSDSDRLPTLRAKMQEYLDNGAELGWLIDAERQAVEIYRAGRQPEIHGDSKTIHGEGPVEGFILDLSTVWNPLA